MFTIAIVYLAGILPCAVLFRRYQGTNGFNSLMLGLSWPMIPLALLVLGVGLLFEKLVKVKG